MTFIETRRNMHYRDTLYGDRRFPRWLEPFIRTREASRARGISLMVLPNRFMWYGTVPSRFHHNMGVTMLMREALAQNSIPKEDSRALAVAALHHDTGNPPFSHLCDPFLQEILGKDGETFLEDILCGSETEKAMHAIGVSPSRVVRLVAGKEKPLSDILHGSLDVDNLDNIGRVGFACRDDIPTYDAFRIASSFRFQKGHWTLDETCIAECKKWQRARDIVYRRVYGSPHLNAAMMLYRAVELAFHAGELAKDFFFLDDEGALAYLSTRCNPKTALLVDRLARWEWYAEIPLVATLEPAKALRELASSWKTRGRLAEMLSQKLRIPEEDVCVYVGKGKEKRRIALPFTNTRGETTFSDESDERQFYRVIVYVPERLLGRQAAIRDIMLQELS